MILRGAILAVLGALLIQGQGTSQFTDPGSTAGSLGDSAGSSAVMDEASETPPPLTCPAGGPIGAVNLSVKPPTNAQPLPFRTINHLSEGDTVLYSPVLRVHEKRHGEVALVMVPAKRAPDKDPLLISDPKSADKPQQWKIPETISLVAFVYGPEGLSKKKVRGFLSQDDLLIAQLADYAAKTAETEALMQALSNSDSSAASMNAALNGFASQYGLAVSLDRTAPPAVQAQTLFATMNPALSTYDPLMPSTSARIGQTASVATAAATLFFGSPIGLAAGGTAMLLDLRALAFPGTQFRSSFAQQMQKKAALNLCGQRTPAPPHTRVAYIWANRIPNMPAPAIHIENANYIPATQKSPVPVKVPDSEWKYLERARAWHLQGPDRQTIPIKVNKLANQRAIEVDLSKVKVPPGRYRLDGYWDWAPFEVTGDLEVRPLSDFTHAHLEASSQNRLLAKTGKIPVTLTGSDFEFTTKVQIKKLNDEFAVAQPVRYILPKGLRDGPQNRMDVQIDTAQLDPGKYQLLISQQDGKERPVPIDILPAVSTVANLPVILNQGGGPQHYVLKGERLNLLAKLEAPGILFDLGPASDAQTERNVTVKLKSDLRPGAKLPVKAYLTDRTEPLDLPDAVEITGPLPLITSSKISMPNGLDIPLNPGEFPAGYTLSGMLDVKNISPTSVLKLSCKEDTNSRASLHLGQQNNTSSLQRLSSDQLFFSFDTSAWPSGCNIQAVIDNGYGGRSEPYTLAHIVRLPLIEKFQAASQPAGDGTNVFIATGRNLEMIDKAGWDSTAGIQVAQLPSPIPGEGQRQILTLNLPVPSAPHQTLYVWLRGDQTGRATAIAYNAPPPAKPATNHSSNSPEITHRPPQPDIAPVPSAAPPPVTPPVALPAPPPPPPEDAAQKGSGQARKPGLTVGPGF